ncbi:hypothetical protein AGR9A_Cc140006 [Agrobacterium salinitolerans str. Hayward 0363]|nr:hypothetical protein AGR9A_Cc140006 [Agrobacterium salinitolerans str. Hayward 0363]
MTATIHEIDKTLSAHLAYQSLVFAENILNALLPLLNIAQERV